MAKTLNPMDLKQILSLHIDGFSNRKICKTLSISRNTINDYISLFLASSYKPKKLLHKSEAELKELFTSVTTIDNDRYNGLMSYFDKINQSRNHPGFTFQFHYNEYYGQAQCPYSYTQFMAHYHKQTCFKQKASIAEISYTGQRNLDKNMLNRLATLNFIYNKENIIITGAAGIGKSFLAQALGNQACLNTKKVYYANTARLFKYN